MAQKSQKQKIIEQFTKIQGVGKAKAEVLYDGGYKSLEKLKSATVEELVKIKGIGKSFAEKIYNNLRLDDEEDKVNEDDGWDEDDSWDESEKVEEKKKIDTKKKPATPNGGTVGKTTGFFGKTIETITGLFKKGKKEEVEKKGVSISETPKKPAPPTVKKSSTKKKKTEPVKKSQTKTKKPTQKVKKAPVKEKEEKPKKDILKEFTSIPGIGLSKAEALYDAGYKTLGDLKKATIKKLTEVKGISLGVAQKIKDELNKI